MVVYVYVCTYIHTHTYVYVCMYVYTHTHTHTHTHTRTHTVVWYMDGLRGRLMRFDMDDLHGVKVIDHRKANMRRSLNPQSQTLNPKS